MRTAPMGTAPMEAARPKNVKRPVSRPFHTQMIETDQAARRCPNAAGSCVIA
jgi:hypothetical protein